MGNLSNNPIDGVGGAHDHFLTTHWTMVLAAGRETTQRSAEALEQLCRGYWYPLYAHVRRQGHGEHEAQDLTQEFFARLLEKNYIGQADRKKGRFRSFLLASLNHFLCNECDKKKALKRGGDRTIISMDDESAEARFQMEPASTLPPDEEFEKQWAVSLLEQTMIRLQTEQRNSGKEALYTALKPYLSAKPEHGEYERMAGSLGMSANAIGVAVKRLRARYRALIKEEVANTVSDPNAVEEEMTHILTALTR